MSRPPAQENSTLSGSPLPLQKIAVVMAAGAVLGTRLRVGRALIIAGLAWMVTSRKRPPVVADEVSPQEASMTPAPGFLDELCVPSHPFMDPLPTPEVMEKLRAELIPPSSLFTPALIPPLTEPVPESMLLQSAPVYVEVEENEEVYPPDASEGNAVLPDTISIPVTPDPPPGLLADTQAPLEAHAAPPPTVPIAGLLQPAPSSPRSLANAGSPHKHRRRSFLEWLRE
ncbi:hypothetical protein EI77_01642 [Prosthecobacter fusiformis]|uniref:Uncharacterized protein n=1 Tax=Prosthecobacter fusiformis TaxID=48464 RepID=A0A4R7S4C0_9BACT|nr:hypothetical protein [Prosthecobacter fusiformis]TDU73174.1 hypothetical protein EI77_01642 [Prosthecobacter fusiformis]